MIIAGRYRKLEILGEGGEVAGQGAVRPLPSAARALVRLSEVAERKFALDTPETHVGYIASGRFVGREREMAALKAAVDVRLSGTATPAITRIRGAAGAINPPNTGITTCPRRARRIA